MHQTEYKSLTAITRSTGSFNAGICKWWYTPINNITVFPAINPVTQLLSGQPTLMNGAVWLGPINIPAKKIGWKQTADKTKAGSYYKHLIEAFNPGIDSDSFINLENLGHYQLCIVAKLRSSDMYIILGDNVTGCDLVDETNSGEGNADTPGTKLTYSWESIDKALILSSFAP